MNYIHMIIMKGAYLFDDAFKAKTITTMRRNKKVKDVTFVADKEALKEYDIHLKKIIRLLLSLSISQNPMYMM